MKVLWELKGSGRTEEKKKQKPVSRVRNLGDELVISIPSEVIKELNIKVDTSIEWSINKWNGQAYIKPLSSEITSFHGKAVLDAIKKLGQGCTTGEIYNLYKELIKKSGENPSTLRRVSGIIKELSDKGFIEAKVESRGRYGRTKRITRIKEKFWK
jgi:bifunctional DNA-binding transcriptional regulator/antitoxin component of YhaV-PrlF toxin-antitoxin module